MEPLLPKKDVSKCDDCNSKLIQRDDDNEIVIKNRLKTYYDSNESFLDFYRKMNVVVDFEPKKGIKDYPILRKIYLDHKLYTKQEYDLCSFPSFESYPNYKRIYEYKSEVEQITKDHDILSAVNNCFHPLDL